MYRQVDWRPAFGFPAQEVSVVRVVVSGVLFVRLGWTTVTQLISAWRLLYVHSAVGADRQEGAEGVWVQQDGPTL